MQRVGLIFESVSRTLFFVFGLSQENERIVRWENAPSQAIR